MTRMKYAAKTARSIEAGFLIHRSIRATAGRRPLV